MEIHPFRSDDMDFDSGSGKKIKGYFSRIGFACFMMAAFSSVASVLATKILAMYVPGWSDNALVVLALGVCPIYLVGFPVFCLVAKKTPKVPPAKHDIKAGNLMISLLMTFGLLYAGNLVTSFLFGIMSALGKEPPVNYVSEMVVKANPLAVLIAVVIISPIVEEIMFRKIIIDGTRSYGEGVSIVFSALLFAAFHGNFFQIFFTFTVGLMFGYIYMRTGRLRNCIFLHMSMNFTSGFLPSLFLRRLDLEKLTEIINEIAGGKEIGEQTVEVVRSMAPWLGAYLLYDLVIFGLSVAGIVLLIKNRKKFIRFIAEFQIPGESIGSTVYMNAGVMMFLILMCVATVRSLFV